MTSPLSAWSTHYDMIKPKYVKRNGSPLLDALTHSTTKLSAVPDAIIGYLDPKVCATHDTCRTASYYRAWQSMKAKWQRKKVLLKRQVSNNLRHGSWPYRQQRHCRWTLWWCGWAVAVYRSLVWWLLQWWSRIRSRGFWRRRKVCTRNHLHADIVFFLSTHPSICPILFSKSYASPPDACLHCLPFVVCSYGNLQVLEHGTSSHWK